MAGEIASLFAKLGFKVDRRGLKSFEKDLKGLKTTLDSEKGVTGATKKATKSQNKLFNDIKKNYSSKFKPSYGKMKEDLRNLKQSFADGTIQAEEFQEARGRVLKGLRQENKKYFSKQRQQIAAQTAAEKRAAAEFNRIQKERTKFVNQQATEAERAERKKQTAYQKTRAKLLQIEKGFDKHSAQLREMRDRFSYVNQEYKKGNITLERRRALLQGIYADYRRVQAAQLATSAGSVGPYAGGADPRQRGTHGLISAIHSDLAIGSMIGGFAAAQSVRSYQGFLAMEQGLTAATGSAEKAGEEFEYLVGLSRELGLFVGDLGKAYSQLSAAARGTSLTNQEVRDTFRGVASQARVLNLSTADTEGVMRSLVQMLNKGQIMAEELKNQMGRLLPI